MLAVRQFQQKNVLLNFCGSGSLIYKMCIFRIGSKCGVVTVWVRSTRTPLLQLKRSPTLFVGLV